MIRAAISGTGIHIPPHTISNAELVESFNRYAAGWNADNAAPIAAGALAPLQESSVAFIEKGSGIKQRYVYEKSGVLDPARMYPHYAERPNEALSMMAEIAVAAARDAMARAGRSAADVDAVICAAANMQRAYPAMAIEIQNALGITGFGFDMNVACSSATFGIEQAANAVRCGTARAVLVVNPEITLRPPRLARPRLPLHLRRRLHRGDRRARGHGAAREAGRSSARASRRSTRTTSATTSASSTAARTPIRTPATSSSCRKGARCSRKSARWPPSTSRRISRASTSRPDGVRRYWLHQANLAMNQLVVRRLLGREAAADEAPVILDEFANTASAGSIIAFHRHHADLAAGDVGVICSFGAGYSIGSVVVRRGPSA